MRSNRIYNANYYYYGNMKNSNSRLNIGDIVRITQWDENSKEFVSELDTKYKIVGIDQIENVSEIDYFITLQCGEVIKTVKASEVLLENQSSIQLNFGEDYGADKMENYGGISASDIVIKLGYIPFSVDLFSKFTSPAKNLTINGILSKETIIVDGVRKHKALVICLNAQESEDIILDQSLLDQVALTAETLYTDCEIVGSANGLNIIQFLNYREI